MEYEKVIVDLLQRIVKLEEEVENLKSSSVNNVGVQLPSGSKRYRFLTDYLCKSPQSSVKLSFEDLEEIIKFKLPDSAFEHRAFWANTKSHSIARSWLCVNYRVVEVNMSERYIVFEKKRIENS